LQISQIPSFLIILYFLSSENPSFLTKLNRLVGWLLSFLP
jgi:hypothetical protein